MTTARFAQIAPQLEGQAIELPSWAFGNSGTWTTSKNLTPSG
ncbi:hypothetical protein [Aeromicrobium sp. REDSEA-S32_B7]|nr:hypothetical protein [Aeromicrobium sp. REDSEA-S32_B7]